MSWLDQRPDDAMAGAFEAIAPAPVQTVAPTLFRDAMSRLGAAVHVITTSGTAGRSGFTATAVCSVTDAPPTLLVCLNRRSQAAPVTAQNGVFCVNTLAASEAHIADAFAGRTGVSRDAAFEIAEWTMLSTGAPVLVASVVAFDCRTIDTKVVGSHTVIFGAVEAVRLGIAETALVYHNRAYKQV